MVRLKDIALQASVSSATVSRILNRDDSLAVTEETREKVLRIADELGYQPSAKKRKNRSRNDSAPLIGVVSCLSPEEERQDPYFSAIRKGIEEECFQQKIFHHFFYPSRFFSRAYVSRIGRCDRNRQPPRRGAHEYQHLFQTRRIC